MRRGGGVSFGAMLNVCLGIELFDRYSNFFFFFFTFSALLTFLGERLLGRLCGNAYLRIIK